MHVRSSFIRRLLPFMGGMAAMLLIMASVVMTSTPAQAGPVKPNGIPTATPPAPPTEIPSDPATPEPSSPPAAPPTAAPPTAVPPTAIPPEPTSKPKPPQKDEPPAPTSTPLPTLVPPTAVPPTAVPPAEIDLVKTIDQPTRRPGETAVYTLTLRNISTVSARDVVITDDVPAWLHVIDLQSSKGAIVVDGQKVSAFPSVLDAGEEMRIMVKVRVDETAPAGDIVNWGRVTTSSAGDTPDNNASSASMTVEAPPQAMNPPVPLAPTPVKAKAQPTAMPVRMPDPVLPTTGDPDADVAMAMRILPWALVFVVLVGGAGAFISRRRTTGAVAAMALAGATNTSAAPMNAPIAASVQRHAPAIGARKLGPPLPQPSEPGALPPPADLDRDSALRAR